MGSPSDLVASGRSCSVRLQPDVRLKADATSTLARFKPIASLHRVRYNAAMTRIIALIAILAAAAQQNPPVAPAPRPAPGLNDALTLEGASPIIENERVAVWDFTWTRGVPGPLER